MKTVGYFDGTDPLLLTRLVALGYSTMPLANDFDEAGKPSAHLEPGDVDLIVGYLHKLTPISRKEPPSTGSGMEKSKDLKPLELLYPAKTYDIPVIVIVPAEHHKAAKEILGEAADFVELVTPDELEDKVLGHLK
jgi:hypothetical protein